MRLKTILVLLCALAMTVGGAFARKTSGVATCKMDPSTPTMVTDMPGHSMVVGRATCTWTKFELDGIMYKDGVTVSADDTKGNSSASQGYHVATLANGDTATAQFHGNASMKDGKMVEDKGTWVFSSGTGKFKHLKGKGSYKGTPNADGTMKYEVEGDYDMK
jgi:hypothetical protein